MSATKSRSTQRWRYVYAIIPEKKEVTFGPIGIQGEKVYTLHVRDIAAVISDTREKSFEVLDYGIPHQAVLEEVMEQYCLIPMGFGQIATEPDIKTFLSRNYPRLRMYFSKLEGKKELGLKVTWKIDHTIQEIAASNIKIRTMKKQIQGRPLEKTYRQRLDLGTNVARELEKRGDRLAKDIFSRLSGISAESKRNKNLTDEMILNAAFLVDKTKERDFDSLVNTLEQEYGDLTLKYVVAPPFNFVNVRIRR
ncbi:MAG: GvpL/GvpF family gas vesicle protein [Methanoregulaceae archaeon]|jgi:hypothetical protein